MKNDVIGLINESYGDAGERNLIDLYIPQNKTGKAGLILFIHGGGWVEFSKEVYTDRAKRYAETGFVAASMNYRYVSDKITIAGVLDDVGAALDFIRKKTAEYGIELTGAVLTGESAGAHISMLYAYSRREISPVVISGVIERCGPTILTECIAPDGREKWVTDYLCGVLSKLCGEEITAEYYKSKSDLLEKCSPFGYVDDSVCPTLIIHGAKDEIVPYRNAVLLDKKLTDYGIEHRFITLPHSGHDIKDNPEMGEEINEAICNFLKKHLD